MSYAPYRPVVLDPSQGRSSDVSEGFAHGYREGLQLARAEAHAEVAAHVAAVEAALAEANERAAHAEATAARLQERTEAALRDLGAAATALNAAAHTWREREVAALAELQHDAVAFGVAVAEAVCAGIPLSAQLKASLAACATTSAFADPVTVRVHPSCVSALSELPGGFDASLVRIVPDDTVAPGAVACELGDRRVDAGFAASLERIRTALGLA
jgi:flagellar biosynthesis/type III secretory pathway protein FliH